MAVGTVSERNWTPEQGEPTCVLDSASQRLWAHRLKLYIAFVVTLTLAVQVFGLPWTWAR